MQQLIPPIEVAIRMLDTPNVMYIFSDTRAISVTSPISKEAV